MTITSTASFAPAVPRLRRVGGAFGSVVRRLVGALDAAEDRRDLHALTDHLLRDVGLMRDGIDDALRESVRRQADHLRQVGG